MANRTRQLLDSLREGASRTVEAVREVSDGRGAAPLHAFFRQGAHELSEALVALPDSLKPQAEMGQVLSPTPQVVSESLMGRSDYLTDRLGEAERSQPQKEKDHEREPSIDR